MRIKTKYFALCSAAVFFAVLMPVIAAFGKTVNVRDYGAVGDGETNDTAAIMLAINAASAAGGTVIIPDGIYLCQLKRNTPYAFESTSNASVNIEGTNAHGCILMPIEPNAYVLTIEGTAEFESTWTIKNITFDGNNRTGNGIYSNYAGTLGLKVENCAFRKCDIGFRNTGTIWYNFNFCTWDRNNYGIWLEQMPDGYMHGGCSWFDRCNWYVHNQAAIYIKGNGMEQVRFNGGIVEGNAGFGFFIDHWTGDWRLLLDDIYTEQNGYASSVIVDGNSYSEPTTFYIRDSNNVWIRDSKTAFGDAYGGMDLVNSRVFTDGSWLYETTKIHCDRNSFVKHYNAYRNGNQVSPASQIYVNTSFHHGAGNQGVFRVPIRGNADYEHTNLWPDGSMSMPFVPTNINSKSYSFVDANSPNFRKVMSVTLPPCYGDPVNGMALWTFQQTMDYWYVYSFDVKSDVNDANLALFSLDLGLINAQHPDGVQCSSREWRRYYGLHKAGYSGDSERLYIYNKGTTAETFYLSSFQLVRFDTYEQAAQYLDENRYAAPLSKPLSNKGINETIVLLNSSRKKVTLTIENGLIVNISQPPLINNARR